MFVEEISDLLTDMVDAVGLMATIEPSPFVEFLDLTCWERK